LNGIEAESAARFSSSYRRWACAFVQLRHHRSTPSSALRLPTSRSLCGQDSAPAVFRTVRPATRAHPAAWALREDLERSDSNRRRAPGLVVRPGGCRGFLHPIRCGGSSGGSLIAKPPRSPRHLIRLSFQRLRPTLLGCTLDLDFTVLYRYSEHEGSLTGRIQSNTAGPPIIRWWRGSANTDDSYGPPLRGRACGDGEWCPRVSYPGADHVAGGASNGTRAGRCRLLCDGVVHPLGRARSRPASWPG
jgi:hypothetical protein